MKMKLEESIIEGEEEMNCFTNYNTPYRKDIYYKTLLKIKMRDWQK
jgi:hypothetical protein